MLATVIPRRSVQNLSAEAAAHHGLNIEPDLQTQRRPSKNTFSQFVNRSRTTRPDASNRNSIRPPVTRPYLEAAPMDAQHYGEVPHTAPIDSERGYRDMLKALSRDKSTDRGAPSSKDGSEANFKPGSSYESGGLFSSFKNSGSKTGESSSKTGRGFFGRFTRSASGHEPPQEVIDEKHILRVIKKPLAEQTRRTRIKERIEDALDKTEYWLPALPYRSIE